MLQPIIKNSYLAEVNITTATAGSRYTFQDIPTLRAPFVFIKGIEAYTASQLAVSPNSNTVIAAAGAASIVCTFAVKETEEIYQIPYYTLIAANNAGLIRLFQNKQINLTKSYITLLSTANINAGESVCFNFYYDLVK